MLVRVFCPTKSTMQSGRGKAQEWVIEPELATPRLPDSLMGWSSTHDTLAEIKGRLRFDTKEEALSFAKARDWTCLIEEPEQRKIRPRNYLDNFRIVRPEDEERKLKKA